MLFENMKNLTKILCCFNYFSRNCIEITIILLSIIGLILNIIGMIVIPWGYTSRSMQIMYLINLIFFAYSLIITLIIKFLRKKGIYEKIDFFFKINAFLIICASIISIFLNIFISIGTIPDIKNQKITENIEIVEPNGEIKIINNEEKLASNSQLGYAIFSLMINLILWIILLFLWLSELIRLKYKIKGSYNDYYLERKNNPSFDTSQKKVINVIGHDKYGFPIYSSNINEKQQMEKSKSEYNYKLYNKYNSKYDIEANNILRYSYKEKYNPKTSRNKNYKANELKLKKEKKEKYIEKYIENGAPNPYYSNFENKSALNISVANNSINPGY